MSFNGILDLSKEYTDVEVIDAATVFLLEQGVQSTIRQGATCAYRGYDGLKCAVGAFIPDSYYMPDIEGTNINTLRVSRVFAKLPLMQQFINRHYRVLSLLQTIHDNAEVRDWDVKLAQLKTQFQSPVSTEGNIPYDTPYDI